MTIQEYAAWTNTTNQSRNVWTRDECFEHNQKLSLFAYFGGENGVYVRITKEGELEVGRYDGAIPHIGEAGFRVVGKKNFSSESAAFQRAAEMFGAGFLRNIICGA